MPGTDTLKLFQDTLGKTKHGLLLCFSLSYRLTKVITYQRLGIAHPVAI